MFGSNILETAMGLVFVYLAFSLVCSGIREWIAVLLKSRAKTLKIGIANLLKDKNLVAHIMDHHLVRVKGIKGSEDKGPAPKYISSKAFAEALLESISKAQKDEEMAPASSADASVAAEKKARMINEMKKSIAKIENLQVKNMLTGMLESVGKDVEGWDKKCEDAKRVIEKWFDDRMELVSAWYKRQTHKVVLGLAVVVCILFNVDTIMITRTLSVNSALRESLTTVAMQTVKQPVDSTSTDSFKQGKELQGHIQQLGLPIGWVKNAEGRLDVPDEPLDLLYKVLGLLMSILAVSMGAPFWFDILKKLIHLSSAPKNQQPPPAPTPAPFSSPCPPN